MDCVVTCEKLGGVRGGDCGLEAGAVGVGKPGEDALGEKDLHGGAFIVAAEERTRVGVDDCAQDVLVHLLDGLVDREPLGAGLEPLHGVRGLLPGGLDEAPEEAGRHRAPVKAAEELEPLLEQARFGGGELAQLGEVRLEFRDALRDVPRLAQRRVGSHENKVEVVEDELAQVCVIPAAANRGGDERVHLLRMVAGVVAGAGRPRAPGVRLRVVRRDLQER